MFAKEKLIISLIIILLFILLVIQKYIYPIEKFSNSYIYKCKGERNGVSGCRDCCKLSAPSNYQECVTYCMLF